MSSNTRVTRSKGQPEAVSLPARMRQSRKSTNTSDQHPTSLAQRAGPRGMYQPGAQPNSRMQNKPQKDASFMDQPTKTTNFTEMSGRNHRISPDSLTQTTDASTVQETTQPMIVQ